MQAFKILNLIDFSICLNVPFAKMFNDIFTNFKKMKIFKNFTAVFKKTFANLHFSRRAHFHI